MAPTGNRRSQHDVKRSNSIVKMETAANGSVQRRPLENDSDRAFLELTEQLLEKAQAVQRDPRRRRPRLRFRDSA
jgi:hypothetical protein